jgi:hypothetical protein
MKKIITVIMIMLICFTGCATADPTTPPVELPFAVHQKGATVSTRLQMVEERNYPFNLKFYYNEKDKADEERVRKLVGGHQRDKYGKIVEPGIPIPLKLTISVIESAGEKIVLEKEILVGALYTRSIDNYTREIDLIHLTTGLYRVTVRSLKDIPELANTKVILGIYLRTSGKL